MSTRRPRFNAGQVAEALVIGGEVALWLVDGDDRIAFVNDAAMRILGYTAEDELIGRPSHDTVHWKHPDGRPYPAEDCPITYATLEGRVIHIERDWWVRKDGSMVPISCQCAPLEVDGRMGTAMTFHDLSASVRADEQRRRLDVERARLAEVKASRARMAEAADAERRRVVRDLHDGAQQRLVHTALTLQLARRGAPLAAAGLGQALDDALQHVQAAIEELRELATGIHPAILTHRGLGPAVTALAARAPCPVTVRIDEGRHPPGVESAAYFVVAEALTNVAKYARATGVVVSATIEHGSLVMRVVDDGVGGADPSRGSGLRGLEDRVAAVGGSFAVTTAPDGGTAVEAAFPLIA